MLGTTFGGNYLACAASIAVLDVIEQEDLITNAENIGNYLIAELKTISGIKEIRGQGLMIGIETEKDAKAIRSKLLSEEKIFTGFSSGKNTIRLLPPLNIGITEADIFLKALIKTINHI
jgi:acetylornithine aminotransferase